MRISALDAPEVELPPDPEGALPGWLKTPMNTGLASVGVTPDMLTTMNIPDFGGNRAYPNVPAGLYYRRRFTKEVAAAPGVVFEQCLFDTPYNALTPLGHNVEVKDSDFVMTANAMVGGTHINVHPYYTGSESTVTYIRNLRMTGGTMFINATSAGAIIEDVYGYAQMPETGGEQHRDGFTSRGCKTSNPQILRRCRFDCAEDSTTGAFFVQDTYGDGVYGVRAYDCLFEGAGYVMTIDRSHDLVLVNNRTNPYGPHQISDYTLGSSGPSTFALWTGNHRLDPDAVDNDYKGIALPQPVY